MDTQYSISKTILKLRKDKGWTQLELAEKLNVTDKAISKWESGKGEPSIEFLPKLAKLFNVTIDYLLTGRQVEAISLDDMDNKKRRDFIIKKDDLDSYIKYGYDKNDRDYYSVYYISRTNVHILSGCFWNIILENNAYKIFKHCFTKVVDLIKKESKQSIRKTIYIKCFVDILKEINKDKFAEFCIREDNVDWLEMLGLKYAKILFEEKKAKSDMTYIPASFIDKIFANKEKALKCFNYLIKVDEEVANKDSGSGVILYPILLQYDLPYFFIKYDFIKELKDFMSSFEKQLYKFVYPAWKNNKIVAKNGLINESNWSSFSKSCIGYYLAIKEDDIKLCISKGEDKLAKLLLEYNTKIENYFRTQLNCDMTTYALTDNEFESLCIRLNEELSEENKIKNQIKKCDFLRIELMDKLLVISNNDSTFEYCVNAINEKPITHFEYFTTLVEEKNWKKLFVYTIDYGFSEVEKLLLEKEYDKVLDKLIDTMQLTIDNYSCISKINKDKIFSLNSDWVDYRFLAKRIREYRTIQEYKIDEQRKIAYYKKLAPNYNSNNNNIATISSLISENLNKVRSKWIKLKKEELERHKLVERMNHISDEITKEYIDEELKKGNIELVIIKLCTKLQAILSKRFNRDDDLFELLNEYCEKDLHWAQDDGWGYDEYCSDDEQIRILNKLRMVRNNIAHPAQGVEPMTADELQKSIEYVFKIMEERK